MNELDKQMYNISERFCRLQYMESEAHSYASEMHAFTHPFIEISIVP